MFVNTGSNVTGLIKDIWIAWQAIDDDMSYPMFSVDTSTSKRKALKLMPSPPGNIENMSAVFRNCVFHFGAEFYAVNWIIFLL